MFTTELTKRVRTGSQKEEVKLNEPEPDIDLYGEGDPLSYKDEGTLTPNQVEVENRELDPIQRASNIQQSVVFVMTDDKIYHYTW